MLVPQTFLAPGTLVHQRYEIVRVIGRGGMGAVYEAIDQRLNSRVALKQTLAEGEQAEKAFAREATLLANLRHPALSRVSDFFSDAAGQFLVMEFIPGDDLATLLSARGEPFPVDDVLRWADQLLSALDYLHSQQPPILHRDIKPQNIKLTPRGELFLLDFGLAKGTVGVASQETGARSLFGYTPDYAPPEQLQGVGTDARSDLYALAATLYHLLTGALPANAFTRMHASLNGEPDPLLPADQANPRVPAAIATALTHALTLRANGRYPSATALAAALHGQLAPDGWSATTAGTATVIMEPAPNIGATTIATEPQPLVRPAATTTATRRESTSDRNRARMLEKVKSFWIKGMLEQSLQGAALIELGMAYRPDAVDRSWSLVVQPIGRPERALPATTSIVDIFDDMGGELLILGAPGAGKTTTLLELARELIARAERDEGHPIPVVFNLSSWANFHRPIAAWLVDELNARYQVPRKIGQGWVDSDQLLPLLDGLDEVPADRRAACVTAINRFRGEHGLFGMAVCSRETDYDLLADRLQLQGAVVLKPLTREQIDNYLAQAGEQLRAVRTVLREDATLQELADTPLMLSIITLAYYGMTLGSLQAIKSVERRRMHLFETYVQRMFERRGAGEQYPAAQATGFLAWLARAMIQHGQTVFFIEGLQPSWLALNRQRDYIFGEGVAVGLIVGGGIGVSNGLARGLAGGPAALIGGAIDGLIAGMLAGLLAGLVAGLAGLTISWLDRDKRPAHGPAPHAVRAGQVVALAGALTAGLIWSWILGLALGLVLLAIDQAAFDLVTRPGRIVPIGTIGWLWPKTERVIAIGAAIVLTTGLIGALFSRLVDGLAMGVAGALFVGLVLGLTSGDIETKTAPNQGIRQSVRNAWRAGIATTLVSGLVFGLLYGVSDGPLAGLGYGLAAGPIGGLIVGLLCGGLAAAQHLVLRLLLARSHDTPRNYARFLDYAAGRLFLRKVGGGYIFIHRLLMEYFAEVER